MPSHPTIAGLRFILEYDDLLGLTIADYFGLYLGPWHRWRAQGDLSALGHHKHVRELHRVSDLSWEGFHADGVSRAHPVLLASGLNDRVFGHCW